MKEGEIKEQNTVAWPKLIYYAIKYGWARLTLWLKSTVKDVKPSKEEWNQAHRGVDVNNINDGRSRTWLQSGILHTMYALRTRMGQGI